MKSGEFKIGPGQIAAACLLSTMGFLVLNARGQSVAVPQTADERIACEAVGPYREFTFDAQNPGVNHAIHAIHGSGQGEGDPCWSEAVAAVNNGMRAIGNSSPIYDHTIQIPGALRQIVEVSK